MEHYLPSVPGNVHWGLWDGTLKPVLTIKSGDRVMIETLSAEPEDMPEAALGFSTIPGLKEVHEHTFRGPGPHFLTGPDLRRGRGAGRRARGAPARHQIPRRLGLESPGAIPRHLAGRLSRTAPHPYPARCCAQRGDDAVGAGTGRSIHSSAISVSRRRRPGGGCRPKNRGASAATWTTRSWA